MSILYGVLSCFSQPERRQAVIDTWANDLLPGDELVFIVGDPTANRTYRAGNLLIAPCPDVYRHLTDKVYWFFKWASLNSRAEYVFKCDDDTYIRPERMASLPDGEYVGHKLYHKKHGVTYASGGAGYRLPMWLLPGLTEELKCSMSDPPKFETIEDMMVGDTLNRMGYSIRHSGLLKPRQINTPLPDNCQATCHYCVPERLHEIHGFFSNGL